jgi:hypothetical protein
MLCEEGNSAPVPTKSKKLRRVAAWLGESDQIGLRIAF